MDFSNTVLETIINNWPVIQTLIQKSSSIQDFPFVN